MTDDSRALVPIEERTVDFYGDEIAAVRVQDGSIYIPIRPICDNLGITLAGQRERINRDPVLSRAATSVSVTLTQQAREMICLPLKFVPGWLFGINANRVKPELRDRVIRYQEECYDVLWEAFQERRLTTEENFDELLRQADPDAVQAYQIAQAVVRLARGQILLEARMTGRLEAHERRLEDIEQRIGVSGTVTEEQAQHISQAVKAIAYKLSEKTGRNEYGGVYSQLYGKFGITSYKLLPAARYDEAMAFLTEWWQQLAGTGDVPF